MELASPCVTNVNHNPLPLSSADINIVKYQPKSKSNNINVFTIHTYASLLQTCSQIKTLNQIHAHMLKTRHDQKTILITKVMMLYAVFGDINNASLVFNEVEAKDVVLWNGIIKGYVQNGFHHKALAHYSQMQLSGIEPDRYTFIFSLNACAGISCLGQGKGFHDRIIRAGFESDVFVAASLVNLYTKCGNIDYARQVFDKMSERDVVSWNALITGYAQNGFGSEAVRLFRRMQMEGVKPTTVTVASVLSVCAQLGDLEQGKVIFCYVLRNGFHLDTYVGNSLITMYGKCDRVQVARQVFEKMPARDLISWNAMIAGYAQNGNGTEALKLFLQMLLVGVKPDWATLVSVLPACALLAALQHGKWIHGYIMRSGFESNVSVGNSLIDMYCKCGDVEIARRVFGNMSERDVVSWNAMIAGYGLHGLGTDALMLFSQMQQTNVEPDDVTFICVLTACSHAGLVDEGCHYFDCMSQNHGIEARMEHYACMTDLLGRAGHLEEAYEFVKNMPIEPGNCVWASLLSACRMHSNIEIAESVAEHVFYIFPENVAFLVLMSNIYASTGMWDKVSKVRMMMKDRGLKKIPGFSLIEISNTVHTFLVGDRSHPQSEDIYATLETLFVQMEEAGYVPNMNFVLYDVEEDVKQNILRSHSEKLAIAFGLINTTGTPIRIIKNLRVCGDCHDATKIISKIVKREIIVRDANRFHHFKDGLCSCGDYW